MDHKKLSRFFGAPAAPFLAAALLLGAPAPGLGAGRVKLLLKVSAPPDTPPYDVLFVSGNRPELGSWNPGAVALKKAGGTYELELETEDGAELEYKYTRGSWDTVEKGADFAELENRRLRVAGPAALEDRVLNWADRKPYLPEKRTVTGDLRLHEGFRSKYLGNARTLAVWLPPSYAASAGRRYPVIYLHDGQNVFDRASSFIGEEWGADEAAAALAAADPALEAIVVGVYNTGDRLAEYTPHRDPRLGGGKGRDYAKFVVREVKPFIDASYRTLPDRAHTSTAGASLGGAISLYLLLEYPKVFSAAGVLSPPLYWADGALPALAGRKADPRKSRIWLSIGTEEGALPGMTGSVEETRALRDRLLGRGFREGPGLRYAEVPGGRHSEKYWARETPALLRFLLGPAN